MVLPEGGNWHVAGKRWSYILSCSKDCLLRNLLSMKITSTASSIVNLRHRVHRAVVGALIRHWLRHCISGTKLPKRLLSGLARRAGLSWVAVAAEFFPMNNRDLDTVTALESTLQTFPRDTDEFSDSRWVYSAWVFTCWRGFNWIFCGDGGDR